MVEAGKGVGGSEIFRFAVQVIKGRWFMMFASFIVMASAGATYLFAIYSKEIKKELDYDQKTLNLLGFFKDLGTTVGILSGLLAEVTPTWFVLLVGSSLNFVGYFMVWISVSGHVSRPKVWQMCLYICIGANSQNFANTAVLPTSVKNFPESRGILIGLLKGFTGLSGAVMTQLYHAIYGDDSKSLILLIAWLPAVVAIFFIYNIRLLKVVPHPNERRVLYKYIIISVVLALFIMIITIVQKQTRFSHAGYAASATVVCIVIFSPIVVTIKEELLIWNKKKEALKSTPTAVTVDKPQVVDPIESSLMPKTQVVETPEPKFAHCFSNIFNPPERGEDYTILQAVLSIDMLIIFIATFCGMGTCLTAIDNLGQIGESLGYPTRSISTFVSLVSIWNYSGRVCAGVVSEIVLSKWGISRPVVMAFNLILACVGHTIIAFPIPGSLYVASVIMGFTYGAHLTLKYIIISELFGLKYYSTLFNVGVMASPLGSYVFNVRVSGKLYDKEALKLKGLTSWDSESELTCIGKQCYRLSFIIMAATALTGALCTLVLVIRTHKFYKGDIYKKFRQPEAIESTAETDMALSMNHTKNKADG